MKQLTEKQLLNLVPKMIQKLGNEFGPTYRIAAAAFSKRGNLLGIEMNGWRGMPTTRRGTGKHAEAAVLRKYGRKVDSIYILRVGNALDILPVHPCEACLNMAAKMGVKIYPIHELLNLC